MSGVILTLLKNECFFPRNKETELSYVLGTVLDTVIHKAFFSVLKGLMFVGKHVNRKLNAV